MGFVTPHTTGLSDADMPSTPVTSSRNSIYVDIITVSLFIKVVSHRLIAGSFQSERLN